MYFKFYHFEAFYAAFYVTFINVFKPSKPVPNQDSAYKPILHSSSCLWSCTAGSKGKWSLQVYTSQYAVYITPPLCFNQNTVNVLSITKIWHL